MTQVRRTCHVKCQGSASIGVICRRDPPPYETRFLERKVDPNIVNQNDMQCLRAHEWSTPKYRTLLKEVRWYSPETKGDYTISRGWSLEGVPCLCTGPPS